MRTRIARFLLSGCSLLVPLLAPPAATQTLVLPGAAHAPGLEGTRWVTDLRVFNPGNASADLDVSFIAYNGGAAQTVSQPLAASGLLALDDVVATVFGAEASGFLTLASDHPLVAGQRTSNLTPAGTFGQYIPAVASVSGEARLTGLLGGLFRTNLGLVNPGSQTATVNVDIAAGRQLDLPPLSGRQLGGLESWSGFVPAGESGEVTASSAIAAYASVVDNRTGDPTYVPALEPITRGVLPGLAHTPGALGTVWRSDVYLHAAAAAQTVTGTLVLYGAGGSAASAQLVRPLAAGETVVLQDVVALLEPGHDGSAVLWLTSDSPLVAVARTYNLAPSGTYGQSMLAIPDTGNVQPGQQGLFLFASRDATGQAGFRSNLGLVNPGLTQAAFTVELLDQAGERLGLATLTVPPRSAVQRNNVVGWLDVAALADGVIRVTGTVPFTGYLSSVDNRTGDASTVSPVAYVPAR